MSVKLSPYPEYKDSGVSWLGNVPAHWNPKRIKHVFKEAKRREPRGDEVLLSLTKSRGLIPQSEASERQPSAEDLSKYKVYRPGELVMNRMQAWSGMFGVAEISGLVSPDYSVFMSSSEDDVEFFKTLFMTPLYIEQFAQRSQGIGSGFNRLYTPEFGAMPIVCPPPSEQRTIIRYLGRFDSLVKQLIEAKQHLISLLEEQKQTMIHSTVTHGLDPEAPMKPTGLDWLPEVQEGWEVKRAKYVFEEMDERSLRGEETHLSMSQKFGLVPNEQLEGKHLISESYVGAKVCNEGDLVLNRLKAHLGVFALAPERGLVSPDYSVFRAKQAICGRYFEWILKNPACRSEIVKRIKGIVEGFWRLYTDDFYQISLPVPSVSEQYKIVRYLENELRIIDKAAERAWQEIELIREYRTRLISDVVTGKLDVRGVELPEVEEIEAAPGIEETLLSGFADFAEESHIAP